jgi:hypothetical protein
MIAKKWTNSRLHFIATFAPDLNSKNINMNRIKILAVSGLLLGVSSLLAQEAGIVALSLKECVKQTVDNNINAVKARIDREKK